MANPTFTIQRNPYTIIRTTSTTKRALVIDFSNENVSLDKIPLYKLSEQQLYSFVKGLAPSDACVFPWCSLNTPIGRKRLMQMSFPQILRIANRTHTDLYTQWSCLPTDLMLVARQLTPDQWDVVFDATDHVGLTKALGTKLSMNTSSTTALRNMFRDLEDEISRDEMVKTLAKLVNPTDGATAFPIEHTFAWRDPDATLRYIDDESTRQGFASTADFVSRWQRSLRMQERAFRRVTDPWPSDVIHSLMRVQELLYLRNHKIATRPAHVGPWDVSETVARRTTFAPTKLNEIRSRDLPRDAGRLVLLPAVIDETPNGGVTLEAFHATNLRPKRAFVRVVDGEAFLDGGTLSNDEMEDLAKWAATCGLTWREGRRTRSVTSDPFAGPIDASVVVPRANSSNLRLVLLMSKGEFFVIDEGDGRRKTLTKTALNDVIRAAKRHDGKILVPVPWLVGHEDDGLLDLSELNSSATDVLWRLLRSKSFCDLARRGLAVATIDMLCTSCKYVVECVDTLASYADHDHYELIVDELARHVGRANVVANALMTSPCVVAPTDETAYAIDPERVYDLMARMNMLLDLCDSVGVETVREIVSSQLENPFTARSFTSAQTRMCAGPQWDVPHDELSKLFLTLDDDPLQLTRRARLVSARSYGTLCITDVLALWAQARRMARALDVEFEDLSLSPEREVRRLTLLVDRTDRATLLSRRDASWFDPLSEDDVTIRAVSSTHDVAAVRARDFVMSKHVHDMERDFLRCATELLVVERDDSPMTLIEVRGDTARTLPVTNDDECADVTRVATSLLQRAGMRVIERPL